jgi:hypothetical protein
MERDKFIEELQFYRSAQDPGVVKDSQDKVLGEFDRLTADADFWESAYADGVRNEGGHVDPVGTIKELRVERDALKRKEQAAGEELARQVLRLEEAKKGETHWRKEVAFLLTHHDRRLELLEAVTTAARKIAAHDDSGNDVDYHLNESGEMQELTKALNALRKEFPKSP